MTIGQCPLCREELEPTARRDLCRKYDLPDDVVLGMCSLCARYYLCTAGTPVELDPAVNTPHQAHCVAQEDLVRMLGKTMQIQELGKSMMPFHMALQLCDMVDDLSGELKSLIAANR